MPIQQRILDAEDIDLVKPKYIQPGEVVLSSLEIAGYKVQMIATCKADDSGGKISFPRENIEERFVDKNKKVLLNVNFGGVKAKIIWEKRPQINFYPYLQY